MSSYHTEALANADIFTVMGSIYAEVARYDAAITSGQADVARQAAKRAEELIDFSEQLEQLNEAQKLEIKEFNKLFVARVKDAKKSALDSYLLPFAVAARLRQFA